MGRTIMGAVVSLDGYIARTDGEVGPLFDWFSNGDVEWKFTEKEEHPFRTTKASRDFMQTVYPHIGAVVIGRRPFDQTNGWGGVPAAGDHVFVITHTPPTEWEFADTAPFTFVTDGVAAAIAQAREFVGDRDVDVAAGQVGGQALRLGLIDPVCGPVALFPTPGSLPKAAPSAATTSARSAGPRGWPARRSPAWPPGRRPGRPPDRACSRRPSWQIAIGLAVLVLPFRIRNYRRPQPPPVHIGHDGLHVCLAEKSWWRAGTYHHLPWPVVSELTSLPPPTPEGIEAPLLITVTAPGRIAAADVPAPVGDSLRSTGTIVLADAVRPDLARAVAHYSGNRCQLAFDNRRTPT